MLAGPGRVEEAWKRRDEYTKDKDGRVGALGLQAEASSECRSPCATPHLVCSTSVVRLSPSFLRSV